LSQDYTNLVENSKFADISIQVGKNSKTYFHAHSLILRIRSAYFREVLSRFENILAFGPEKVILFDKPNTTPKLFEILLRYIYDSTVDLTNLEFSEIIFLLWGAHELCLKELCNYIKNIIIKNTDLVRKHFSLINREGLSNFTKLATLCKKFDENDVDDIKFNNMSTSKVSTVTDSKPTITKTTYAITSNLIQFTPTCQLTIQSNIIEQKHIVLIVKWINEISNLNQTIFYTFNLLQRASRHGSCSKKFHAWCDAKETSKNVFHSTSTSFIFSLNLQNLDNSIVSKVIDTKHAIKQNKYTGPSFGINDLKICGAIDEIEVKLGRLLNKDIELIENCIIKDSYEEISESIHNSGQDQSINQ
ncbi:11328_t:CDS:2, partial [Gigaspora rosea]